jgi:membrane protein YqaA with SNARE-associated domain
MHTLLGWLAALRGALVDLLQWVQSFSHSPRGVTALFLIAFAESSFFPIPPDVLLIPLCLGDPSRSFWFATVCSLGSVLGGTAGYGIGRFGGRPLLLRMFRRERVAAVETYYDRYNAWATGIAALTPIPYKVFTIAGGAFAINFRIFLLASAVGRSARFFGVATLIFFFGPPISAFLERYLDWLTVAFAILLVLGFLAAGHGIGRSGRRAARTAGDDERGRDQGGASAPEG